MRQLRVDLEELAAAFEDGSYEMRFYLDLETGQVELVTEDELLKLEALAAAEGEEALAEREILAMEQLDIPEWQQERVAIARAVDEGFGTRYIAVPHMESYEAYNVMERFIATVDDAALQNRLDRAINGRGAFRRFKDVVYESPQERERWFAYRDACMRQRVLEWLESEEIEAIQ